MKKFTLIFAALLLVIGVAFAQTNGTRSLKKSSLPLASETTTQGVKGAKLVQENLLSVPSSRAVIYSESFESTTDTENGTACDELWSAGGLPTGWTTSTTNTWKTYSIAANIECCGDPFAPRTGSRMMANSWSNSGTNNWAFSAGFSLEVGTYYNVNFWYSALGWEAFGEIDNFEVRIGQTATASGMSSATLIFSYNQYGELEWGLASETFTPTTSGTYYLGFRDLRGIKEGYAIIIDDIEVSTTIPPCAPVTNLNATVDNNDVTLTWTAATGTPTEYEIFCNGTSLTTVTTTSYTATNVPNGMSNFCVAAIYGTDCVPQNVCTEVLVGNVCKTSLHLVDSYGDSWNGAILRVKVNGTNYADLTVATNVLDVAYYFAKNDLIEFVWAATGSYPSECQITIYDTYGDVLFTKSGMSGVTANTVIFSYTHDCSCAPPVKNLKLAYTEDCDAVLTWKPEPWIKYCVNDVVTGQVGYAADEGNDMTVAIRFTPDDLEGKGVVSGQEITKIALGIGTDMAGVDLMEIKIWEGGTTVTDAGTLKYTQPITGYLSFTENTMTEITLTTPYVIDATKELRIGWRLVNNYGYPFGRDAGPAVPQKGTLFQCPALFSGNWVCHNSQMGWNYNYSIKAFVEGEVISTDLHNIYRDGDLIASNVAALTYTDDDFDALLPHEWSVAVACGADEESFHKSVSAKECDRGGCDDFIVGTGITTTNAMPVNTFYNHSYVQHLYTASEIGYSGAGLIKSISFEYIASAATTKNPITIYLGNTSKSEYASTTDWVPISAMKQVFTGSVTFNNEDTWFTIVFDEPFVYTGCNLAVAVLNNHGSYSGSTPTFRYTALTPATNYKTLHYRVDGTTPINPLNALTAYERTVNRSNTMFEICPNAPVIVNLSALAITGATQVQSGATENYTVTISNRGTVPAENFVVKILNEDDDVLGEVTVTAPLELCASTQVVVPATLPNSPPYAFSTLLRALVEIEDDIDITNNETQPLAVTVIDDIFVDLTITGTPASNNSAIPFEFSSPNSVAQSIYLESEIDITPGNTIHALSYKYQTGSGNSVSNVPIKVSIAYTEANSLSAWVPFATFTQVYSGTVTIPNTPTPDTFELIIALDEPFVYEGGNLCIMTERVYLSSSPTAASIFAQLFTATPTNRSRFYRSVAEFTMPTTQAGTALSSVPVITFYSLPEYTLEATYNPTEATVAMTPNSVFYGDDATLTFGITSNCYQIVDVVIGGTSYGSITSHNLTNITANPIVEVITAPHEYEIVATAGPDGTISPLGTTSVCYLGMQTYLLVATPGFVTSELFIDGEQVELPKNNRYTFSSIDANHTIHITFEPCPTVDINYIVEGMGVIHYDNFDYDGTGTFVTCSGFNQEFAFVPNFGYEIDAVYIDGVHNILASSGQYTFINLLQNHTMRVVFKAIDYTIVATAGVNGTITPSGVVTVSYNQTQRFNFTPNEGFVVDQVFVDNQEEVAAAEAGYYDFEGVSANHTIHVTFKQATLVIHISWTDGGTVNPFGNTYEPTGTNSGDVYVQYNDNQMLEFTPAEGYKVSMVYVNDEPYPNALERNSYTFYYVTAEQWLHVAFEKQIYPITSKAYGSSMISPLGTVNVEHGTDQTYTYYALPGHEIANVFIDGIDSEEAVANGTYTFENVIADHTIDVVAVPLTYKILATASEGGFITPSGEITVSYGNSQFFTFAVASGYEIEQILIDGVANAEALQNGAYGFLNVQEDHKIHVVCTAKKFQIASFAAPNGSVDPIGITELNYGEDVTYTITPDAGYKVSYVLVNDINMGEIETYTFAAVEADGTIQVFFDIEEGGGGLGIDNPTLDINIYSNTHIVYIVNKNHLPIDNVSIFDMSGRMVWQGKPQGNQIALNVANGIYTVRVISNENFTTKKVNIQR